MLCAFCHGGRPLSFFVIVSQKNIAVFPAVNFSKSVRNAHIAKYTAVLELTSFRHAGYVCCSLAHQLAFSPSRYPSPPPSNPPPKRSKIWADGFHFKVGNLSAAMLHQVQTKYAVDMTCLAGIV